MVLMLCDDITIFGEELFKPCTYYINRNHYQSLLSVESPSWFDSSNCLVPNGLILSSIVVGHLV